MKNKREAKMVSKVTNGRVKLLLFVAFIFFLKANETKNKKNEVKKTRANEFVI
jgi:hypothetical protein